MTGCNRFAAQILRRRVRASCFCFALLLAFFHRHASAQQAAGSPELKQNPRAALEAFEAPANQEYELGRGDEITVEVVGRPELSGKHIVGPDGAVTMPFAGSVKLEGKTREQSAEAIKVALAKDYTDPSVSVGVDRYTSNRVMLLGAVQHPGPLQLDEAPTLLEVLARGGVQGSAENPVVLPEECEIYRGRQSVMIVQLAELLQEHNPQANLRLMKDDIVVVPSAKDRYVSILGEVTHPGTVPINHSSTLVQLLAQSGGITPKAGRSPDISVVHTSTHTTQIVHYKDLLTPAGEDVKLASGDIIVVPESGFNRVAYTIEKLSPALTILTVGALFLH